MNIINSKKADFLIVGCGLAGATFARLAAESGKSVHIIDSRNHIGGNCFTYKDEETSIEVHKYGPHIFHTNSKIIWEFINRFSSFYSYIHRVKANYRGCIYSLPINLHTINQFFNKTFTPNEAESFIESIKIKKDQVENFEDYILTSLGEELYNAFFRDYTIKQWGKDPKEIPVSTAKRLPIRFNYNDNYFNDIYQGIPTDGYTGIFKRMLDHLNIKIFLNTGFDEFKNTWRNNYTKLIFSGSIDNYFDYRFGYLPYRTVSFKEIRGTEILGTAIINFTDLSVPYTRIHEHKWFTPEKVVKKSIAFEEYSNSTNSLFEPYYPIRNLESESLFKKYQDLSLQEKDVVFIGRLAEFRYYDMHQVIASSISKFKQIAGIEV
jgi:UDP-galactopyranose mutase